MQKKQVYMLLLCALGMNNLNAGSHDSNHTNGTMIIHDDISKASPATDPLSRRQVIFFHVTRPQNRTPNIKSSAYSVKPSPVARLREYPINSPESHFLSLQEKRILRAMCYKEKRYDEITAEEQRVYEKAIQLQFDTAYSHYCFS